VHFNLRDHLLKHFGLLHDPRAVKDFNCDKVKRLLIALGTEHLPERAFTYDFLEYVIFPDAFLYYIALHCFKPLREVFLFV
jgi:hypothetical protein